MVVSPKFKIVRAALEDREKIVDFLRQAFFKYEPLNMVLGCTDGPASSRNLRCLTSLDEGTSLIAADENGAIVGVCLNGEDRREEHNGTFHCTCSKYSQILKVVTTVGERADVWKYTKSSRGLGLHVLAVDCKTRGQGLGRILLEKSRELAREEGYEFITVTCTGAYSAHLPPLMGMNCIYSVPYTQLVAEGLLPTCPPEPHKEIKVFFQSLTE
ncbi:arylalkylamine N-acetyltransferase 1 [Anabrus simplex]|uniref:arylalkylamine N-acetyltransferase 1 n=1 Tax=Anabrus simplex TaxID=316456 RepID=UPI0034DD6576